MYNLQDSIVRAAGAYVCVNGLYVFALGIRSHQGCTPVYRLGGHLERDETGWQCAVREASEEADINIKFVMPTATYLANGNDTEPQLQKITWTGEGYEEHIPFLAVQYFRENHTILSLMYLAETAETPKPSSEVKGLLLMRERDIHQICEEQITLQQYLDEGSQAILNGPFDNSLPLYPFLQLRLLSRLLKNNP